MIKVVELTVTKKVELNANSEIWQLKTQINMIFLTWVFTDL